MNNDSQGERPLRYEPVGSGYPTPPQQAKTNKKLAVALEIVLGWVGFLGIGWIYSGITLKKSNYTWLGLGMLVVWLIFLMFWLGGSIATGGIGYCLICVIPGIPLASGLYLNSRLK